MLQERDRWLREEDMPGAMPSDDFDNTALFHDSSEQNINPSGWGAGIGNTTVPPPAAGNGTLVAGGTGVLSPSSSSAAMTAQGKKKNGAAAGTTTNGSTTGNNTAAAAAGIASNGSNSLLPSAVHTPHSAQSPMSAGIYSRLNTGG